MKSILWNREEDAITPMENIEQTICLYMAIKVSFAHPNGVFVQ
jgi:hypothetical protein